MYVFKNWGNLTDNDIGFDFALGDKAAMYEKILNIHRALKESKLIDSIVPVPIIVKLDIMMQSTTKSNRPGFVQSLYECKVNPKYRNEIRLKLDDNWYTTKINFPVIF
ncbi:hypothetical protein G6F42_026087 [Rhizopus arrhizus]|nr:hypothetical protein G6F42_026087 [Rhizopus arrhizus]